MVSPTLERWLPILADPAGGEQASRYAPMRLSAADLAALPEFADRHGVLPIVERNLRAAMLSGAVIEQCRATLRTRLLARTGICLMLRGQLAALGEVLRGRSVPHTVLKGVEFADRLYPEPVLRTFTDIDLLVPRHALAAAEDALREAGYSQKDEAPGPHHGRHAQRNWKRAGPGGTVELHWDLVNSPSLRQRASVTWDRLERDGAGRLLPESLLLIASVHGATGHRFDRLLLLCDVCQSARGAAGQIDPARMIRLARACGAELAVAAALTLAGKAFREPACDDLLNAMSLSVGARFGRHLLTPEAVLWRRSPFDTARRQIFRQMLKYA